ncbi:hypothetical protein CDP41_14230 [Listeria monocytogenes]|nr:hypothetical protein [Listeria monocytogenes]EDO0936289.1 hypothetical protein [Listeria monocytogenes]MDC69979.1 hypothetical protein [Listeria monocytogenes]
MNLVPSEADMEQMIDALPQILLIIIIAIVSLILSLVVLAKLEPEPHPVEKNTNADEEELDFITPLKLKKSSIFIRGCWTILNCVTYVSTLALLLFEIHTHTLVLENMYIVVCMSSLYCLITMGVIARSKELNYIKEILNKYNVELDHEHLDLMEANIIVDPKDLELIIIWLLKNENSPFIVLSEMKEIHLIYYILSLKLNFENKN